AAQQSTLYGASERCQDFLLRRNERCPTGAGGRRELSRAKAPSVAKKRPAIEKAVQRSAPSASIRCHFCRLRARGRSGFSGDGNGGWIAAGLATHVRRFPYFLWIHRDIAVGVRDHV